MTLPVLGSGISLGIGRVVGLFVACSTLQRAAFRTQHYDFQSLLAGIKKLVCTY